MSGNVICTCSLSTAVTISAPLLYVHGLDARPGQQQFRGELGLVAVASGGVTELARIGLGIGDQLRDRVWRKIRRHDKDRSAVGNLGDRREALDRIVAGILHKRRHDAERRAGSDQHGEGRHIAEEHVGNADTENLCCLA